MDNEIWENVDIDNKYMVSNFGRVKSLKTDRILKQYTDRYGYLHVGISMNGKSKNMLVHRLVALTYLPNLENKPEVNHLDGDKTNNCIDNLEWVTSKENVDHAYKIGLRNNETIINNGKRNSKKIYQLNIEDNSIVKIWDSASQIGRELGCDKSGVLRCCTLENDTINGYRWRFEETLKEKREMKSTGNPPRQIALINSKTNKTVEIFNSAEELADYLGVIRNSVYRVINGNRKTVKGYSVKYTEME